MGSFLTQCAATHQSIQEGQPCVIIPIFQNADYDFTTVILGKEEVKTRAPYGSTCYYNAFWQDFGLPIRGKYNDYGTFQLIEDQFNRIALNLFFEGLSRYALKTVLGKNSSHEPAVDLQTLLKDFDSNTPWNGVVRIWEQLELYWHDNRIFIDKHHRPAMLARCVVSQTAYDTLADLYENTPNWDGKLPRLSDPIWEAYVTAFTKMEDAIKAVTDDPELDDKETKMMIAEIKEENEFFDNEYLRPIFSDYHNYNPVMTNKQLGELLILISRKLGIQESKVSFYYYLKYLNFINGIETVGIRLSPMLYVGQDYGNDCGHMYAELIKRVSDESKKEQKAQHEEDNDPETDPYEDKLVFPN